MGRLVLYRSVMSSRFASIERGGVFRHVALVCITLLWVNGAPGQSAPAKAAPKLTMCASTIHLEQSVLPQAGLPLPESERPSQPSRETEQYTLSPERYEKAVAYSRAEYRLYFFSSFLGVLVLLVLLRLSIPAKLRDFAEGMTDRRLIQGLIFIPLLVLILEVFELPLDAYSHALSLSYNQSIERWGSWLVDWSKQKVLDIGIAVILVLILFGVIRWSPRRWWLLFWLAALPILLFIFFISPWYLDPLFHKFEPLDAHYPQLAAALDKAAQRAGLATPSERIFLMYAGEKTNAINAYVTGFGASKRIVVWDTTIQKLTPDETLFIFAHEAGHYVLGHVRNSVLLLSALLLAALYLSYRGVHWALDRWGKLWKIYGPEDWASLALLVLLLRVLWFFSTPITSGFSRMQEHAADVYGLELIHPLTANSQEVAAHAFQVLGEIDLADPSPPTFIRFWLYSHPPLADRLVFARRYDPWSKGQLPKYGGARRP